jgi:hypothetical protein
MGNLIFVIISLTAGVGIAFLISQSLSEGDYAVCLIILLVLLGVGGEFLPIIRKVPVIERSWGHLRRFNDENVSYKINSRAKSQS